MSLSGYVDLTLCVRLAYTLGHFLWQGVAVFFLLWLVTSWMRRCSSNARYIVSLLGLLLMVICLAMTFVLMGQEDIASATKAVVQQPVFIPATSVMTYDESMPISPSDPPAITETPSPLIAWQQYAPYITMGYLLGVMIMLCRVSLALQGGWSLRRRSQPVEDPRLLEALARQAKALGLSFTPAIGYCQQVVVPTVIGVVRPVILLPISLSVGLSTEQIEVLIAHELAHIRRYDSLVNILQLLIEAVLFFHPCVWLISRRIRLERENCCDDLVLAGGVNDVTYADSLFRMAEIVFASRTGHTLAEVAALGAADHPAPLRQRILRIIGSPAYKPVRLASGPHASLILVSLATSLAIFQVAASGNLERVGDMTSKSVINGNVYILGQVTQPGAYPISEDQNLTLMQLIMDAGGYDGNNIKDASVMLSRYGEDGKRNVVHTVDLHSLSKDKGDSIFLRNGDFVTLSSESIYYPQYTSLLVVGADRMTFQGQDVSMDQLPSMLQTIPNRPYTLLCLAMAENNEPSDEQFNDAIRQADIIVDEYGFKRLDIGDPRPLGNQGCCMLYLPIESMHDTSNEEIPVSDSLLETHTSNPPGQSSHCVRLVVGADKMTFQGQDINWQQLPEMLKAVPNRDRTVFAITTATDSPPGDKFYDAERRAIELQQQYGFERLKRLRRPKPLGSVGLHTYYIASKDTKRTT